MIAALQPTAQAAASLQDRAVLARLTVTAAGDTYTHQPASKELVDRANASRRSARAVVSLWPGSKLHAAVRSARAAVYAAHRTHSLPWLDDGARILAVAAVSLYEQRVGEAIDAYTRAAREMADHYAEEVAAAKAAQGTLFDADRYPEHSAAWRDQHTAERALLPMPDAADLRLDVPAAQLEAYRQQADAAIRASLRAARADLIERLRLPLERMAAALGDPGRVYRYSLMANLREAAALVPTLDPDQSPELARIAAQARQLGDLDPQRCRDSALLRINAASEAANIERKLQALANAL